MANKTEAELRNEQQAQQPQPVQQPQQVQAANVGSSQVTSSGGSGSSGSSSYSASYSATVPAELPEVEPSQLQERLEAAGQVNAPDVKDAPDLRPELDRWLAAAQEQANNQINYATETGIRELQRAQEDAQPEFQKQRNQIAIDEQRALDNQALYAETRGDRGGIGQAQYNSIQNTAMQNRLQVQQQQTKLATDTARQIADLRSRGEFEKADKALELTQSYLSQLIQLEQWAASYNMDAAQFRWSIEQWKADYAVQMAKLLEDTRQWDANYGLQRANFLQGQYEWSQEFQQAQDQIEYDRQQDQQKMLADAGEALLGAGILPSDTQLLAMGMTREQAQQYINALLLAQTSSSSSNSNGGGGSRRGGGGGGYSSSEDDNGGDGQQQQTQTQSNTTNLNRYALTYNKGKNTISFMGKSYSPKYFMEHLADFGFSASEIPAVREALRKQGMTFNSSGGSGGSSGSGSGGGSGSAKPNQRQRL